jgi:DNA (cytosine-5)-methyltransferase 1
MSKHLSFIKHIDKKHLPTVLSVGSDCSGIEAAIQALKLLGITVNHMYSCDNDPVVRESIAANYKPKHIYDNIVGRDHKVLPRVDLYVAGFPCQTFSMLGKREGFDNAIKGTIFFECCDTIRLTRPKCFILENVKGLLNHDKGNTFKIIMDHLQSLETYHINYHVYNTVDYGLPQNRERVYIVGMHKQYFNNGFTVPKTIPLEITVADVIDTQVGRDTTYGLITEHKLRLLRELIDTGKIDSVDEPWCVNLNVSSVARTTPMKHICPCLLAGEGGNCIYYFTPIRRRLTPREYLQLQGFPDTFKQVVSNSKMYKQVGNSMSTSVLCAIYSEIYKHLK